MSELISEQPVNKTRKPHRCHGCLEMIPVGTPALASTNVEGGKIYTLYFCRDCAEWFKTECVKCRDCYEYNDGMFEGDIKVCRRESEEAIAGEC